MSGWCVSPAQHADATLCGTSLVPARCPEPATQCIALAYPDDPIAHAHAHATFAFDAHTLYYAHTAKRNGGSHSDKLREGLVVGRPTPDAASHPLTR